MKNTLITFLCLISLWGCKEPVWNKPPDGSTPGPVTSFTVKNLSGKSVIHYDVTDANTLYVEAEYSLGNGEVKKVKASKYVDSLVVEGFPKAQSYDVQLYAVGANEQRSAPVKVVVAPNTPAYISALASLTSTATFGGITINVDNGSRDALVIETLRKEPDGTWQSIDRYYSSTDLIRYNIRGLQDSTQHFAFFIRDRWLNFSDTVEATLTPLTEIQIPPGSIENIPAEVLPGTAPSHNNSSSLAAHKAIDGVIGRTVNENYYLTMRGTGMPQHFNVDLKKQYQLSRLVFYQRPTYFYRSISPRKVAVWGSNSPAPDGSFDGWTLLGEFEVIKPSGLPMDINSDEDNAAAEAGHNFEFESATMPIRYLRIQTLETWAMSDYITLTEYSIFGNVAN